MTITACVGCGKGLECECGFSPEEKIRRDVEAFPFDSTRQRAARTGLSQSKVSRVLQPVTNESNDSNVTDGYDPKVRTERVETFVALWKQMDTNEHDHVIRLIVGYMQGRKVS